jgi:predicted polyphosphate/ATP-dependent NAD kinase
LTAAERHPTRTAEGRARTARLGLVVNPIAGMGGAVGLKGTDGPERLARAVELGAVPTAPARVALALHQLQPVGGSLTVVAAAGAMGAHYATEAGFTTEIVGSDAPAATSGEDTQWAAAEIAARGVDLLLFAGGDGTARDVMALVGTRVPVLGIPTGVKMHSGVFAATPRAAGDAAAAFLRASSETTHLASADVVDREPDARGEPGAVQLYGEMLVPRDRTRVLSAKATAGRSGDAALRALQSELVRVMEPDRLYILGPGASVGGIRRLLGIPPRPLAIAAVQDRRLVGDDLNEAGLLELLRDGCSATIVLGVIGGQGSLLGRGNQPLSPSVLRRVGVQNLEIVCSLEKLTELSPLPLRVDTGDPVLDAQLCGFRLVRVAPRRGVLFEVAT